MSQHVTEIAGVVEILEAIADLTPAQVSAAANTEVAGSDARTMAVELVSALYSAGDAIALKKAIEEAVAPLELGGPASSHLEVLAGDAAFSVLLTAQDAGQPVAGALTSPWKAVVDA